MTKDSGPPQNQEYTTSPQEGQHKLADSSTGYVPGVSLSIKLLAAFVVVVVVAAASLTFLAERAARREFTRFISENQTVPPEDLVAQLAALYAEQGDWTGIEDVLGQTDMWSRESRRTPAVLLADAQGRVVTINWGPKAGDSMAEELVANGWPVEVNGKTVGTLIVPGSRRPPSDFVLERFSPEGEAMLERLQRAFFTATIIAGAVALVIAGLLAWGLIRPLRQLRVAAEGIARGDLSQRVSVMSGDEVGELAGAFNYMASELERGEHLRRNMTADVAHELRTPLSIVRGKLEGVLDGIYPATPEHLEPVLEATEVLTYLVEDLRLLAQAEAGQLVLEKRAADIADLIHDAQVNFDPQASDRGVALTLNLPPALPQVMADRHRIVQILSNLLTNALRHTPEGGCVTLSASAEKGLVKVAVADTGTGIPPEDVPQVFDRFWRGEKSRSRAGGGSGLGLAIAKQLVELHGGTIGLESTPGEGSVFWFALPIV